MARAVIVGASSGIGAATRQRFEDEGWETVCLDRTHGVDVCDRNVYRRALVQQFDAGVDVLVYCAGVVEVGPLVDLDAASWDQMLEVNLTGAFQALQIAEGAERPSVAVLVASTAGTRPSPLWAAYAASKAALINLGQTADAELKNVKVCVIAPGRCATPLRALLAPDEDPDSIMQPESVADVIFSLATDYSNVLSGSPIRVAES